MKDAIRDTPKIAEFLASQDKKLIEKNCGCFACREGITRKEIREYFKNDKVLGQKLATLHNIYFFKNLFREIRNAIVNNKLEKLEKECYNYL